MPISSVHTIRINSLREKVKEKNADSFLVNSMENIFYLTGFTGSSGVLFINKDDAELFTDPRYSIQAKKEVKAAKVVIYEDKKQYLDTLKKLKGKTIGFSSNNLTHHMYKLFNKQMKNSKLKDIGCIIEELREIKDQYELKIIRSAIRRAEKSLDEVLLTLKEGDTEFNVKNRLELRLRDNGCDKESFDTIVVSGKNSALIHGKPSNKRIKNTDLVLIDFGGRYKNYCTDKTCTVMLAEPGKKQKEIYKVVMEAKKNAIDKIRDGVSAKHIYDTAMDHIKKCGYGEYFLHGLGHGVGIQVHESPMLTHFSDTVLKEGMVVTIEPGIYIENFGGIRLEDMVYITKTGSKVLTKSQKTLNFI